MPDYFGHDFYTYITGQRHKVGTRQTIRPAAGETNGAFERRMDALAQELSKLGCRTIDLAVERRAGLIVECIVEVRYDPRHEIEIAVDERLAGGRVAHQRAGR